MRNIKGAQQGFSLIEAMLGIFLVSYCLLAVVQMAVAVVNTNQAAREYTMALSLAQNKLEEAKKSDFKAVSGTEEKCLNADGIPGAGAFDRRMTVTDQSDPELKTVTIQVLWGNRIPRKVVLATILAP